MKTLYLWAKRTLKRIDIFDGERRVEIPQESKMAQVHDRILKERKRKNATIRRP